MSSYPVVSVVWFLLLEKISCWDPKVRFTSEELTPKADIEQQSNLVLEHEVESKYINCKKIISTKSFWRKMYCTSIYKWLKAWLDWHNWIPVEHTRVLLYKCSNNGFFDFLLGWFWDFVVEMNRENLVSISDFISMNQGKLLFPLRCGIERCLKGRWVDRGRSNEAAIDFQNKWKMPGWWPEFPREKNELL